MRKSSLAGESRIFLRFMETIVLQCLKSAFHLHMSGLPANPADAIA